MRTVRRLVRAYGTLAADMLGDARGAADLGRCFGADLTEREVDWLIRTEWARTAADVLWRRSKLGLRLNATEVDAFHEYLAHRGHIGGIVWGNSADGLSVARYIRTFVSVKSEPVPERTRNGPTVEPGNGPP